MASGDQREANRNPGHLPDGWRGLDQLFDADGLYQLRAAVAAHAEAFGAGHRGVEDLMIISGELASNAIRHGGGGGRLRLWRDADTIGCQVSDAGPGLADPEGAGRQRPAMAAVGGRGLWVVRQMSDRMIISSGPEGTTVTAVINLDR